MIEKAGCDTALVADDAPAILSQILHARPLKQIRTPGVEYFFQDLEQVEHVPFTRTWEEARNSPFCVLHTSGSTGIPKPVFVTYGTFACNDAHQLIPRLGGKPTLVKFLKGKRYFLALPLFHAACLTFTIGYNIFAGVTSVIPPPEPLTADLANEIFTHGNIDGALLAPSLIVDCFNNNEYCVNMIQRLKFLSYVGGSLPAEVGNALATRIKLMTLMGSCETALHPLEINDVPADWEYLTISKCLGHSFRKNRDGYSELVIKRTPEYEVFQGVFSTFPEIQEFASGDLFEQHPRRSESWVFRARTDDIIAFTTAEKLNPITMESMISTNPKIKSALVGGQGKFQASLLLEPYNYPQSQAEEEQYINDIWPSVLQANRDCPAHGRIMKGFVMITKPAKPIPRAGKGSVQRQAALNLYDDEFEKLYARMQAGANTNSQLHKPRQKESMISIIEDADDLDARIAKTLAKMLPVALEDAIRKTLTHVLSTLHSPSPLSPAPSITNSPSYQTRGRSHGSIDDITDPATHGVGVVTTKPNTGNTPLADVQVRLLIYDHLSENLDTAHMTDDTDLFSSGLDSLLLQSLLTTLNAHLIRSGRPDVQLLQAKQVYEHSTVGGIVDLMRL